MNWVRRGARIAPHPDGRLCEFRFTRQGGKGIVEKVVSFTRTGLPGLTTADYERADRELRKKAD